MSQRISRKLRVRIGTEVLYVILLHVLRHFFTVEQAMPMTDVTHKDDAIVLTMDVCK